MVFLILISNSSSYSVSENFSQTFHFQVSTVMAKVIAHRVLLVYLLASLLSWSFTPMGSTELWSDRTSPRSVLQKKKDERECLFHVATVFPTSCLLLPDHHKHPLHFILHTQLRHPSPCLLQNTGIPIPILHLSAVLKLSVCFTNIPSLQFICHD